MSRRLLLLVLSAATVLTALGLGGQASAQQASRYSPSSGTTSGNRHIISASDYTGSFYSPVSTMYLYVPRSHDDARLTLTYESPTSASTGVGEMAIGLVPSCTPPVNRPGYNNSTNQNRHYVVSPNINDYVRISNNQTTATMTINGVIYNVYCAQVSTDAENNVFFKLSTNNGALLGTYPGASNALGTGYASSQVDYDANRPWSQHVSFSAPCNAPGSGAISLYDMDTYLTNSANMRVRVRRESKYPASDPRYTAPAFMSLTGNVTANGPTGSAATTYTLHHNITMGDAESWRYQPAWGTTPPAPYGWNPNGNGPNNVIDTAEYPPYVPSYRERPIWNVTPSGFTYDSDHRYTVEVNNIGGPNLIRIKLPYDQIHASVTCPPPNTPPSGSFTISCTTGTGAITVGGSVSDTEGGTLTVVMNVNNSATPATRTITRSGAGTLTGQLFTGIPDGRTYTVTGTVSDPGGLTGTMTARSVSCPRPPTDWECTFATSGLTDGRTEVGSPFNIVVTISNTSAAYALGMNQSTHPVAIGASPAGLSGLGPASGYTYSTGSGPAATPLRTATVTDSGLVSATPNTYTFTVTVGGRVCTGATARVGNYSYMKEFGGDVWTGGSFASSCTPPINSPGRALGFARQAGAPGSNGGTPHSGMSTQLTLTALMNINGVYSASHRDVAAETVQSVGTTDNDVPVQTYPPKGLTFANTGTGQPDLPFGGGFGENSGKCITDYFNDTRDITLGDESFTGTNLSASSGRTQFVMNGGAIGGGAQITILNGKQIAIFSAGNVYIRDNIAFDTDYASLSDMPNFALIVCGSIYIDRAVTRIDGLLVAQPGRVNSDGRCVYDPDDLSLASSGTIYTCATGLDQACTAANVYAESNTRQLSVNGSLVAHRIKFLRTYGSLRSATATEAPDFATGAGTGAAEVVNYTPQMYLARSALRTPGLPEGAESVGNGAGAYDSLQVLPPVF